MRNVADSRRSRQLAHTANYSEFLDQVVVEHC